MNQYIMLSKRKKIIISVTSVILLLIAVVVGWWVSPLLTKEYFKHNPSPLTAKDGQAHGYYIYPGASMDSVLTLLRHDYEMPSDYEMAQHLEYLHHPTPRAGYYQFAAQANSKAVLQRLASGHETPVRVTFTNVIRTREQLAGKVAEQLLIDSVTILQHLEDSIYMSRFGMDKENSRCLFLPDTYELYWSITIDDFFARMQKEYNRYWNEERLAKADSLGLSPIECSILASIVEREQNESHKDEFPIIASLYLNRVHRGIKLQACPTVKYAVGDFGLRRILNRHLETDSPYNTYKYAGLPPGPIGLPKKTTIDCVLNAPPTDYLFMCANTDGSGTHKFSKNHRDHQNAANEYHRHLDQQRREAEQQQKEQAES